MDTPEVFEKYFQFAKTDEKNLQKVLTTCLDDHQIADEDFEGKGHLNHIASKII